MVAILTRCLLHADTGLTEDVHDWSSLEPGVDPSWVALESLAPPSATQQVQDIIALQVQPAELALLCQNSLCSP